VVEEFRLMGTPSGLDYAAVEVPIRLWHGDADAVVPLHHAQHVARLLPEADLEVLPAEGHLHPPARWTEIVNAARDAVSRP
jgi:pimeloyl-ACP methyl ester carboxylesterase